MKSLYEFEGGGGVGDKNDCLDSLVSGYKLRVVFLLRVWVDLRALKMGYSPQLLKGK